MKLNHYCRDMELESNLEKIINQTEFISEMNKDLKEAREAHPKFEELHELKKEVKKTRDEIEADEAVAELKDQLSTAKERLTLLKEILIAQMQEEEVEKVTAKNKQAVVVKSMKIKKADALGK